MEISKAKQEVIELFKDICKGVVATNGEMPKNIKELKTLEEFQSFFGVDEEEIGGFSRTTFERLLEIYPKLKFQSILDLYLGYLLTKLSSRKIGILRMEARKVYGEIIGQLDSGFDWYINNSIGIFVFISLCELIFLDDLSDRFWEIYMLLSNGYIPGDYKDGIYYVYKFK